MHRRVLDGERRPARRAHRGLDRRGACPDPHRRGPPAVAQRGPGDHPGARRRGWLQRPVRALAGLDRLRRHRGQPAGQPLVGAGVEGDRLSDRPGRGADRGRAGGWPRSRTWSPARPWPPSSRPSTTWSSSCRASRSTSSRGRPDARQPDEGDRRGDGHRPDLRLGAQQGAARAGAGGRRAAGRGSDAGRPTFDYLAGVYAGDPDADDHQPIRWVDAGGQACESTRHAERTAAPIVLRQFLAPSDTRLWRVLALLRRGVAEATVHEATGINPWFLAEFGRAVGLERDVATLGPRLADPADPEAATLLATAKRAGFGDRELAALAGVDAGRDPGRPAGPRPAARATRWSTRAPPSSRPRRPTSTRPTRPRVAARGAAGRPAGGPGHRLGAGPDRAGDRVRLLRRPGRGDPPRRQGWSAVMINSNPETVSTDFDASTRLYFEPLDPESVLSVIEAETGLGQERPCPPSSSSAARRRSTWRPGWPPPACRSSAPTSRRSTRPRSGPASPRSSTGSASRSRRAAWPTASRRR